MAQLDHSRSNILQKIIFLLLFNFSRIFKSFFLITFLPYSSNHRFHVVFRDIKITFSHCFSFYLQFLVFIIILFSISFFYLSYCYSSSPFLTPTPCSMDFPCKLETVLWSFPRVAGINSYFYVKL
jgi:hypothetical protein